MFLIGLLNSGIFLTAPVLICGIGAIAISLGELTNSVSSLTTRLDHIDKKLKQLQSTVEEPNHKNDHRYLVTGESDELSDVEVAEILD